MEWVSELHIKPPFLITSSNGIFWDFSCHYRYIAEAKTTEELSVVISDWFTDFFHTGMTGLARGVTQNRVTK